MEDAGGRGLKDIARARGASLLVLTLSVAVLALLPTFWLLTREDVNVGSLDPIAIPAEEASRSAQAAPSPTGEPRLVAAVGPLPSREPSSTGEPVFGQPVVAAVPVRSARLADVPDPSPAPVSLRIPDIGVRADVTPVGLDPDSKQVEVPTDRTTVAWYEHSPSPGDAGSAVLTAHVDYNGGPGAFFELRKLGPGAIVSVGFEDGSKQRFEVIARRRYRKDELPRRRIFAKDGKPVLTLLTCGGGFNQTARAYDSNVVVVAIPVGNRSRAQPEREVPWTSPSQS